MLISPGNRRIQHWEPEGGPTGHWGAAGHDRSRQRLEDHCSPSGDHNPQEIGQQDLHSYPVVDRTGRLQSISIKACQVLVFLFTYHHIEGSRFPGYQGSQEPEHSEGCCRLGWDQTPEWWESCLCPTIKKLVSSSIHPYLQWKTCSHIPWNWEAWLKCFK